MTINFSKDDILIVQLKDESDLKPLNETQDVEIVQNSKSNNNNTTQKNNSTSLKKFTPKYVESTAFTPTQKMLNWVK